MIPESRIPNLIGLAISLGPWEATVQLSDPILDIIKTDESLEFISLKEAINLLATKTKSTTFGVATYLLNQKVHSVLHGYYRSIDYEIHISSYPSYKGCGWVGENYAFQWLQYITENEKHLKKFRVSNADKYNNGCEEALWKRVDFFNLECIKNFYLSEEKEWNVLFKKQQYIWDGNYLSTQLSDNSHPLDIDENQYLSCSFSIENANYPEKRWMDESFKQIKSYPLFFKHKTFSPHEAACLMAGYNPIETQWDHRNVNWLKDNSKYEEASNFIYSVVKTDLFEEHSRGESFITSENLKALLTESGHFIDGFNDQDFANTSNENLAENTQLKKTIANLELDVVIEQVTVKELNAEIEKLKTELLEKEQKIKELELLHKQNDTDLMSLIFDKSATDRYAPDLVLSIKLWEHIYITNPKSDSHTNKAAIWLKDNAGYEVSKKSGSASKIREITTPFISWGTLRDKNYKK